MLFNTSQRGQMSFAFIKPEKLWRYTLASGVNTKFRRIRMYSPEFLLELTMALLINFLFACQFHELLFVFCFEYSRCIYFSFFLRMVLNNFVFEASFLLRVLFSQSIFSHKLS